MEARISVVTLGVRDLPAARAFYGRLGWKEAKSSNDSVAFFDLSGVVLALWDLESLARDANVHGKVGAFSGVTLAHNVRDRAEVDRALAHAKQAGAKILVEAHETFWGGYSGYFADPEGHAWEVAHNPFWPLDPEGRVHP